MTKLEELMAVCEGATDGNWRTADHNYGDFSKVVCVVDGFKVDIVYEPHITRYGSEMTGAWIEAEGIKANIDYIATFNPVIVRKLLRLWAAAEAMDMFDRSISLNAALADLDQQ